MDKLASELRSCYGVSLASEFVSKATYNHSLDFIEYVADDCFVLSERIDAFLTILKDGDTGDLVGFKLKGFAFAYNEHLKPILGPKATHPFIDLVPVLTYYIGQAGNEIFGDLKEKRKRAYESVAVLVQEKEIKIDSSEIPLAA